MRYLRPAVVVVKIAPRPRSENALISLGWSHDCGHMTPLTAALLQPPNSYLPISLTERRRQDSERQNQPTIYAPTQARKKIPYRAVSRLSNKVTGSPASSRTSKPPSKSPSLPVRQRHKSSASPGPRSPGGGNHGNGNHGNVFGWRLGW